MIATATIHRRGFALTTAITMMSLIGTMLLVMGTTLSTDARRTIDGACDAQLRQLLLVGGQRAIDAGAGGSNEIKLPAELAARGGRLAFSLSAESDDSRIVCVDAQIDGRTMRQEITLERRENNWRAVGAVLSPGRPVRQPATRPSTQTIR